MQSQKVFFDTEFTGLHKDTTLISIGLIADSGETFYAELNDYDKNQIDPWIKENVIENLEFTGLPKGPEDYWSWTEDNYVQMRGNKLEVARYLADWFQAILGGPLSWIDYESIDHSPARVDKPLIEMWSDCLAYDWVLFNDLWGSASNIPKCVYNIPFDISTYLKLEGRDPDITREDFIDISISGDKHNALYDAKVIRACYEKLLAGNRNKNKIHNQIVRVE